MSFVRRPAAAGAAAGSDGSGPPRGCAFATPRTLVTSSGIPSLDSLFLDGIPLGTIVAVREDWPRSSSNYTSLLLKCVLAQGVVAGHHIIFADGLQHQAQHEHGDFLAALPLPAREEGESETGAKNNAKDTETKPSSESPAADEKMTIAWRYKHLRQLDSPSAQNSSTAASTHPAAFDFRRKMDLAASARSSGSVVRSVALAGAGGADALVAGAAEMAALAKDRGTVLRIVVRSFASPYFAREALAKTVYRLRRLLTAFPENVLVVMSIPAYLYAEAAPLLADIETQCDVVLEMQPFPPDQDRPATEHLGILSTIKPLRSPASLALLLPPETTAVAFRMRRRQLCFEPFSIPPCLDEPPASACGGPSRSGALDF